MRKLEFLSRAQRPECLDGAGLHPGAGMYSQVGGLVQDEQVVGFMDESPRDHPLQGLRDRRLGRWGKVHGGHVDDLSGLQTVVGFRPAPVHPHRALAQQAEDQAGGGTLETGPEKLVQAPVRMLGGDGDLVGGEASISIHVGHTIP